MSSDNGSCVPFADFRSIACEHALCRESRSRETATGVLTQTVPFGQVLYDELDMFVLHKQWRYMQGGGGGDEMTDTPRS
jgi:hypothetical protein